MHFCFQFEQINAEYKVRALQYHPDKNDGNVEAQQKFQLLKVGVFVTRKLGGIY